MKNKYLLMSAITLLAACQSNTSSEQLPAGVHAGVVQEVLQTSQYTYLHVKEGANDPWLAVSKMQAANGSTYYYRDGLPMNDFVSKELNRTFKQVLFLDNISTTPNIAPSVNTTAPANAGANMGVPAMAMENPGASDMAVLHTVVAEEVLQTTDYTYIRGKENNGEIWFATAKMEASVGKTYYFKGGLPMTNFSSKELKRTFGEIFFIDKVYTDAAAAQGNTGSVATAPAVKSNGSAVAVEKKEIKVQHGKDEITIGKLFENKKSFAGKTVKVKGEVTKFNTGIMKKNWIHLQDGTEFSGKFDLMVTTLDEVKVGDKITVEGIINLDKDFGFGYFYDVILEDAKIVK